MSEKTKIHVVTNTHWDREHRHGFQETRLMLVDVIDQIIDIMEADPEFKHFVLDGQTIVLDDYFELKPEHREKVMKLVQAGRLHIGPWYSLVDAGSVTPECIVRNLLKGHKLANELGGVMKFGYSIFSFGQISQLPQLYAGFGINDIIFYKGYNPDVIPKSEFIWESPDGTQSLTSRLGYWNRYNFYWRFTVPAILGGDPADEKQWFSDFSNNRRLCHMVDSDFHQQFALEIDRDIRIREDLIRKGIEETIEVTAPYSFCPDTLLGFDGIDFSMPINEVIEAIKIANEKCSDIAEIVHSTPMAYFAELRNKLDLYSLPVHKEEMRMGPVDNIHSESMGANIEILRDMSRAERTLLRYAEPLSLWNWMSGKIYPFEAMDMAWKYLFQVHAHDSIHALGDPKIKRDSLYRIDQAQEISDGLTRRAMENLVGRIDASGLSNDDILLTVFNPSASNVGGVSRLYLNTPAENYSKECWLETLDGIRLSTYTMDKKSDNIGMISPENRPKPVFLDCFTVDIALPEIPAMGYRTFRLCYDKNDQAQGMEVFSSGHFPANPIAQNSHLLDNGLIRLKVNVDGTIDLTDLQNGECFEGLLEYIDKGCRGDCWVHHEPNRDRLITSLGSLTGIEIICNTSLRATVIIRTTMELPVSLSANQESRSAQTVHTEISTEITMLAGSRRLDVRVSFDNAAKDHFLRVRIPTGINTSTCHADAPFDVIERNFEYTDDHGKRGPELTRQIVSSFVDLSDGSKRGLAVFCKTNKEFGLEYSAGQADIMLSLLRAVDGKFPVDARVMVDYGDDFAQCLGPQVFEFALLPHTANWQQDEIAQQCEQYLHPFIAAQFGISDKKGDLPLESASLLHLAQNKLLLSSIKPAENGKDVIIRLFNPSKQTLKDTLILMQKPKTVKEVRLDETFVRELDIAKDGSIPLTVSKGKIYTLAVEL